MPKCMNSAFGGAAALAAFFMLLVATNTVAGAGAGAHGHPQSGFHSSMVVGFSYRQWECEKIGWHIIECPSYSNPVYGAEPHGETVEPRYGQSPAPSYQQPLDECMKTGYGIAECPNFGRKPVGQTVEPRYGEPPPVSYKPPLDECMKTGWGITGCPNYGKKPEIESPAAPSLGTVTPYPRQLDDCMKTGWGITECPNYGRKPTPVQSE